MTVRLAHLSDIHFGGENATAVAAAADHVREADVDLVVVSGDLTKNGEVREFEAAAAWLKTLPAAQLVTPGNHDTAYMAPLQRVLTPFRRYERIIGPAWRQTFLGKGFAVCGLNTARGAQMRLNWSKGQIRVSQAEVAAQWFEAADPACVRIVAVHHPLIEMLGGPMTAKVWGGEAAAQRLAEAKVDLVLSGHIHAPFTWPYPYADGKTYAVGAGTLSVRERGVPPGFNLVEVEEKCFRVIALAWSGSRYEPYRTWSLDRRPKA